MTRPRDLWLVLGTGTDVGKTWWTAQAMRTARAQGWSVSARKPVQSFDVTDPVEGRDASVLAAATGEDPRTVCPPHRDLPIPMAPPIAAAALALAPFTLDQLVSEIHWPLGADGEPFDVGVVESVGGVRSPMAADGDSVDLISRLRPNRVVLIADGALGAINAVRLAVDEVHRAMDAARLDGVVDVVLNRFDNGNDVHRRNAAWLDAHFASSPGDVRLSTIQFV